MLCRIGARSTNQTTNQIVLNSSTFCPPTSRTSSTRTFRHRPSYLILSNSSNLSYFPIIMFPITTSNEEDYVLCHSSTNERRSISLRCPVHSIPTEIFYMVSLLFLVMLYPAARWLVHFQILSLLSVSDLCTCIRGMCHSTRFIESYHNLFLAEVSRHWRSLLQKESSVWRHARFAPQGRRGLSIPDPPPGMTEWCYGTWLFGRRKCSVSHVRLKSLPYSNETPPQTSADVPCSHFWTPLLDSAASSVLFFCNALRLHLPLQTADLLSLCRSALNFSISMFLYSVADFLFPDCGHVALAVVPPQPQKRLSEQSISVQSLELWSFVSTIAIHLHCLIHLSLILAACRTASPTLFIDCHLDANDFQQFSLGLAPPTPSEITAVCLVFVLLQFNSWF